MNLVFRAVLRLWLLLLGTCVLVVILGAAALVAVLSLIWSLMRGRRPVAFTVFRQFQQASRHTASRWYGPRSHGASGDADVVDVQAKEMVADISEAGVSKINRRLE